SNKIDLLNRILRSSTEVRDKVLIFSQRLAVLDYLSGMLEADNRPTYRLDGHIIQREKLVNKFNKDIRPAMFLISTTVRSVGLNIQGANRVVIFDFGYTPTDEQ
ncbi:hypothetical protein BR93DRAFT_872411, partial [Coniochaeta sp. PMI_546]